MTAKQAIKILEATREYNDVCWKRYYNGGLDAIEHDQWTRVRTMRMEPRSFILYRTKHKDGIAYRDNVLSKSSHGT